MQKYRTFIAIGTAAILSVMTFLGFTIYKLNALKMLLGIQRQSEEPQSLLMETAIQNTLGMFWLVGAILITILMLLFFIGARALYRGDAAIDYFIKTNMNQEPSCDLGDWHIDPFFAHHIHHIHELQLFNGERLLKLQAQAAQTQQKFEIILLNYNKIYKYVLSIKSINKEKTKYNNDAIIKYIH